MDFNIERCEVLYNLLLPGIIQNTKRYEAI